MHPQPVRVRFAPSPTGGLHLGGVRTALFNYLFAKKNHGTFVLRIEDTDQTRYVQGAEQYIIDCLTWCGIAPDEGPHRPGKFGPYRQSERKEIYKKFAEELVEKGFAYYAFDTPEDLEKMREELKTEQNPSPQYNHLTRMKMSNSLTLSNEEVKERLSSNQAHVIRIKMPENREISFTDMIRGEVTFQSQLVDDKVLLKADGMPTYHLAVVVDDHAMEITHAFRGEEWLPSAPVHILLWEYLGWKDAMPQWAHFPLILKPDGQGKLSKRDGDRLGFPVFAMDWKDPKSDELTKGFKEMGFLPEAFINMLALLGWNDGSGKELFTKEELVEHFSVERIHKAGAKFDFEKAKWYNQEWIKTSTTEKLLPLVKTLLQSNGIEATTELLEKTIPLTKERCHLLNDFIGQLTYFFNAPKELDSVSVLPKWDASKSNFFSSFLKGLESIPEWTNVEIENCFKSTASTHEIKPGDVQLPFRIMLVGGKFGPPVFEISAIIGKESTLERIKNGLHTFNKA
ncbi:MAG: glutamate--tRNA ligase [Chitinophagia bacterium]|jgi:glutamyl-tRNA synthetase|nr:glutamate--tRNA ligase [Chitinophagia bacterium]